MRKPDFCKCENKDRKADQRLCFHYTEAIRNKVHKTWKAHVILTLTQEIVKVRENFLIGMKNHFDIAMFS